MKPGRERKLVTAALIAGQFLAAIEATAVATAMPTAVADLHGVSRYSWAFSAYLLTSTTTVPLFGKLADLYGRLRIYLICTVIFLAGSALCGTAHTFNQLVVFRALQGIGAGGVIPISTTLVGDIYTLQERGRMQGLFSGAWALSSLSGPVLGGIVTDAFSWRAVFFFAIPFGIASAVLLWLYLKEPSTRREHKLDVMGTVLLTVAVTALLVAILEGSEVWGWGDVRTVLLLGGSVGGLIAFIAQEKRVAEPMLPLDLFANRVIAVGSGGSLMIGCLLFSLTAYVPMYMQGVLAGSARDAGAALMPMMVSWPIASTLSGRLMLRVGYRPLIRMGSVIAVVGLVLLAFFNHSKLQLGIAMGVSGLGMGFMATPYLVSVQNAVPWRRRGVATSTNHFFRTIGGSVMVAVLGVVLNSTLHERLGAGTNAAAALAPHPGTMTSGPPLSAVRSALGAGLHNVFAWCLVLGIISFVIGLFFPGGTASSHAHDADLETEVAPLS